MAFQQIDDDATLNGAPLDQATLKDVEGNLDAARAARRRAPVWVADALNPLRLCGLGRVCVPFLHRLTPGTVELTVRVRHQAAAETLDGCTLGIAVQSVESALGRGDAGYGIIYSDVETTTITSAMTSKRTDSFVIDGTTIEPLTGWVVVWVTWTSDEGTPAAITNPSGVGEAAVLDNYGNIGVVLDNPASPYSATDAVLCDAIEIYDHSASTPLTQRYQVLRVATLSSGLKMVYTRPPMPSSAIAEIDGTYDPAADYARRIPLGYTDLYSVQIVESDANGWPDHSAALDAGREASGPRTFQALYDRAEYMLRAQTRAYACGPAVSYTDDDPDLSPAEPLDRFSTSIGLTTSWQTIQRACVGYDDLYAIDVGAGSVGKRRVLFRVVALLWGHHYERENQTRRESLLDVRLVLRDPTGVASAVTETLTPTGGWVFPTMPHKGYVGPDIYQSNPAALLQGLFSFSGQALTPSSGDAELLAHSLRSAWTQGKWQGVANHVIAGGGGGMRWITGTVKATSGSLPWRTADLEIKLSSNDNGGGYGYRGGRFVHCAGLGVIAEPVETLAETDIGGNT